MVHRTDPLRDELEDFGRRSTRNNSCDERPGAYGASIGTSMNACR